MDLESVPAFLDPDEEDPTPPLSVIPLFSGGASGARYCEIHDDRFGEVYEFPVAISSTADAPVSTGLTRAVDTTDIHDFYAARDATITDRDVRQEYDAALRDHLTQYDPDLLMLSGYMYLVTDPLITRYPIINVHPADLRITDTGERTYTGMDAVYDAIVGGEEETRSSVHFVTKDVDGGPLLVVSSSAPVHTPMVTDLEDEALRTYVDLHQDWMKDRCDGPAFITALHLLATGRVALTADDVTVDGTPGPYVLPGDESA